MADSTDDPFVGLQGPGGGKITPITDDPFIGLKAPTAASPPPLTDPLSNSIFHTPAYGLQEIAKGAVSTAALPAQADSFLSWLKAHGPDLFSKTVPGSENSDVVKGLNLNGEAPLPTTSDVAKFSNKLGLDTLKPSGLGEELLGGAARGLGSAGATIPLAPAGALMQLGAGVGGGALGEIASKIAGSDSYWAPIIAGVIGGLTVGKGVSFLSHLADLKAAKAAVADTAASVATAQQARDSLTTAKANSLVPNQIAKNTLDDVFNSAKATHEAARDSAISASKTVHDDVISQAKNQIDASKSALDAKTANLDTSIKSDEGAKAASLSSIADSYGKSTNLDSAGKIGQAQARAFVTPETGGLARVEAPAWQPLIEGMAEAGPQDISNFSRVVSSASSRGGELADTLSKVVPNATSVISKTLDKFSPHPEIGQGPISPGPSFSDMKELRSAIGEARGDPGALKTIGEKNLNSMYAAITSDMQNAADSHGLGDAFLNANEVSRSNREFIEGPMSTLGTTGHMPNPGKDTLPGTAASRILSEGTKSGENLASLRANPAFSPFVDELASTVVRKSATDPTTWTGLSPNAKEALVPDASHRAFIDSLLSGDSPAKAELEAAKATHADVVKQNSALISNAKSAFGQDKAQAQTAAKQAIATAQQERTTAGRNMLLESKEAQAKNQLQGVNLSQAQTAAAAAREKLQSFKVSPGQHGINALVGADLGEHLGNASAHLLGLSGIPYHASALAGAVALPVLRTLKNILTQPNAGKAAFQGGNAANPLIGRGRSP